MKIYLSIFSILCFFAWGDPDPKVEWDKIEHDFGVLEHRKPVKTTFVFKNISDDSIRIDNIRTTCGCTSPIWSNEYVMSGDTSHIVIEYDSQDKGEFYKQIKVFFRKQRKAEKLLIYGDVLPGE